MDIIKIQENIANISLTAGYLSAEGSCRYENNQELILFIIDLANKFERTSKEDRDYEEEIYDFAVINILKQYGINDVNLLGFNENENSSSTYAKFILLKDEEIAELEPNPKTFKIKSISTKLRNKIESILDIHGYIAIHGDIKFFKKKNMLTIKVSQDDTPF